MNKIYYLLLLLLTVPLTINAQTFPTTFWSDHTDVSWYSASQDNFTISTPEALAGLSELVSQGNTFEGKSLIIDADIDLDAHLWSPIGPDNNFPFSGSVDGDNYTISNLWINQPTGDWIGLFGQTIGASFSNILLDTANVLASDTSGVLVGNLSTNGSMQDCHVTNASIIADSYNIGGLTGGVLTNSTMTRCSFIGDVVGENQVGGLSGTAWNESSITESYSEGTVSGAYLIGGLVGYCTFSFGAPTQNTIDNCYSRSMITASFGRAGGIYGGADASLVVLNSYATGTVTAPEFAGGVIGAFGNGINIQNTYFDMETSGQTEGVGGFTGAPSTYGIEGRTSADMKTTEILNLLNSGSNANLWTIIPSLNDGYPVLNSFLSVGDNIFEAPIVTVYPTIFTDKINLSTSENLRSYKMYNVMGALVQEGNLIETNTIDTRNMSSGMYLIEISTETTSVTKKLIKK